MRGRAGLKGRGVSSFQPRRSLKPAFQPSPRKFSTPPCYPGLLSIVIGFVFVWKHRRERMKRMRAGLLTRAVELSQATPLAGEASADGSVVSQQPFK